MSARLHFTLALVIAAVICALTFSMAQAHNYIAHISGDIPTTGEVPPNALEPIPGGWQSVQWNLLGTDGINAVPAWANLKHDGRPFGRGVIVAVVDTGVAYKTADGFTRAPDLPAKDFVPGYDFIAHDALPFDRNGHGTYVASIIASDRYLKGVAPDVKIMPIRVLGANGEGNNVTIADGINFAVKHGAQIINLSLEFDPGTTAADVPDVAAALRNAYDHHVLVVAAAGNEYQNRLDFPASSPFVLSVGATTEHLCLGNYSNHGPGLDIVAPGGGPDANIPGDANCDPNGPISPSVLAVTFKNTEDPHKFGIPNYYYGTSMATPEVSAVAALVIASGVIGHHPSPAALIKRLEQTARPIGPSDYFGAGLLDAAAATTS